VESSGASSRFMFNTVYSSGSKYFCTGCLSLSLSLQSQLRDTNHTRFSDPFYWSAVTKCTNTLKSNPILRKGAEISLTECSSWGTGRAAAKWELDHSLPPSFHPIYDAHLFAYRKISHGNGILTVGDWCRGWNGAGRKPQQKFPIPLSI
jgi:hypothetical protein